MWNGSFTEYCLQTSQSQKIFFHFRSELSEVSIGRFPKDGCAFIPKIVALEHILKRNASGISMKFFEKVSFLLEIDSKNFVAPTNWGGTFCGNFNT